MRLFSSSAPSSARPGPVLILLTMLCVLLWLAGGASRADAAGQVIVRAAAWGTLVVVALASPRLRMRDIRPGMVFLLATLVLVLVQLVPLPPAIWQALPGRAMLSGAAMGDAQPWRPWAIVPGAAWNAAGSLVVPAAILVLAAALDERGRAWLLALLLGMVVLSALFGLLQFSGAGFNNPFVNDTPGQVSGSFANRNHFALFLAMGCVLAPAWAFYDGRRPHWRGPVAIGLVLLFALTILATGSRAGLILGVFALALALALAHQPLRRELRRYPRWVLPVLIVAMVVAVAGLVLLSVAADRAASITRIITAEGDEDLRTRALPTVLAMVWTYFPAGSGFGGFDPLFRIQEPYSLLKPTYFNHAHNDFLEILLDGGVAGVALLLAAIGWWGVASVHAWRMQGDAVLPRLGSALLVLVLVASLFDYPARTPIVMAVIAIAATWLDTAKGPRSARAALPDAGQQL